MSQVRDTHLFVVVFTDGTCKGYPKGVLKGAKPTPANIRTWIKARPYVRKPQGFALAGKAYQLNGRAAPTEQVATKAPEAPTEPKPKAPTKAPRLSKAQKDAIADWPTDAQHVRKATGSREYAAAYLSQRTTYNRVAAKIKASYAA